MSFGTNNVQIATCCHRPLPTCLQFALHDVCEDMSGHSRPPSIGTDVVTGRNNISMGSMLKDTKRMQKCKRRCLTCCIVLSGQHCPPAASSVQPELPPGSALSPFAGQPRPAGAQFVVLSKPAQTNRHMYSDSTVCKCICCKHRRIVD